jgi:hypothetical protein
VRQGEAGEGSSLHMPKGKVVNGGGAVQGRRIS